MKPAKQNPKLCPTCGQRMIENFYGYPGPEEMARDDHDEYFELAGDVFGPKATFPKFTCIRCGPFHDHGLDEAL